MSLQEYLAEKVELHNALISLIKDDTDDGNLFTEFENIIDKQDIPQKWNEFLDLLCVISAIIENHHKHSNFIDQIEKVLHLIKHKIQEINGTQKVELFKTFRDNRQFIILLFKTKIISIKKPCEKDEEPLLQIILKERDPYDVKSSFY